MPAPCEPPPPWIPDRDPVVLPAGGCHAQIIETQASNSLFSWGGLRFPGDVAPRYTLRLTWRRLSERPGAPLEVAFPGGTLMVMDGQVGWWEDDLHWLAQPWSPFDITTGREHDVVLQQDGRDVRAWINGVEVPSFRLWSDPRPGRLSIGLKGGTGERARLRVDHVVFRPGS
jgi:hypothetical protein